ncbi:MAG TPA: hypothetical protein VH643_00830 [Gemmataceae bacterium]|jgi:hypothetical protein
MTMSKEEAENLQPGTRLKYVTANGSRIGKIWERNPSGHAGTYTIGFENNSTTLLGVEQLMKCCTLLPLDRQKIDANLAKFLADGFIEWPPGAKDCPIVYRVRYVEGKLASFEVYHVRDDISPEILEHKDSGTAPSDSSGSIAEMVRRAMDAFINTLHQQ